MKFKLYDEARQQSENFVKKSEGLNSPITNIYLVKVN